VEVAGVDEGALERHAQQLGVAEHVLTVQPGHDACDDRGPACDVLVELPGRIVGQRDLLDVTDVIGGFQAWRAAGLPVQRPPARVI
jgi:hypothetical protein